MRTSLCRVIGLCLIVCGLCSCATLKGLAKKPMVNFQGLDVQGLGFTAATLIARFEIENPNGFNIKIDRLSYGLKLNGRNLTSGELNDVAKIDGMEKASVEVPVRLKYADLIAVVREVAEKKQTSFQLAGSVRSGTIELPFEEKGELDFNQLPF